MQLSKEFANSFEIVLRKGVENTPTQAGEMRFNIGRLTIGVMADFEAWAHDQVMIKATRLASQIPEDGRRFAIESAVSMIAREGAWGQPVVDSLLQSPQGLAKLIHLLVVPEDRPRVTIQEIMRRVDIADKDAISAQLFRAAGVDPEKPRNPPEAATTPPTGEA